MGNGANYCENALEYAETFSVHYRRILDELIKYLPLSCLPNFQEFATSQSHILDFKAEPRQNGKRKKVPGKDTLDWVGVQSGKE